MNPFGGSAPMGRGRGGASGPAIYRPTISGAPTADPGDVVLGSAVAVSPGRATVVTQNPTTVSRLPSAMAVWEIPLVDMRGATIDDADDFDLEDMLRAWVWASSTTAPTDVIIAVGFSAGAVNATSPGACVALQAGLVTGTRWTVLHGINAGAGWSYTAATADNALTKGAFLQVPMGTAVAQARVSGVPVDATGAALNTNSAQSSPGSANSQAGYDRMFVGIGWATGTGGAGATIDIGATALLLRMQEATGIVPF